MSSNQCTFYDVESLRLKLGMAAFSETAAETFKLKSTGDDWL